MEDIRIDLKELVKRVGGTGDFIEYEPDKCDGCGKCADVCSMGLWSVKEGKAHLSKRYRELCLECAGCWEICEREAIDFWYPKGGTGVVIEYG
jgi:NAD-dependent dihydropyrimidine dehydrogenase PreA subunit